MRVEKIYNGYWNFHSETFSVSGSLTVGSSITLNLVDLNKKYYEQRTIDCLRGVAIDDNNDSFFFILYDLDFIASVGNTQGLQTYEYSVSYLVFSSQSLLHKRDNITSCLSPLCCKPNNWFIF